jgi:hypothetical protein
MTKNYYDFSQEQHWISKGVFAFATTPLHILETVRKSICILLESSGARNSHKPPRAAWADIKAVETAPKKSERHFLYASFWGRTNERKGCSPLMTCYKEEGIYDGKSN